MATNYDASQHLTARLPWVIASQFLRGFAENVGIGDPIGVRAALEAGAELAEAAIADPRAGTMLSVMQAAAEARGGDLAEFVTDVVTRAGGELAGVSVVIELAALVRFQP